ncbi:related to Golgi apparatus membrane protein TVP23 [Saccharomycodes ludwigii]|uniref:Golgi apparatus membrane protein TVP23 n=1 Tax=Saccharomycodes ludwigii TaxID=36035 RepID=A0A376B9F4_9ASCO|nr:hypothetical protein SCDLUD_001647 [Saccharomycodes ludwigii]KAH3901864.1 hypothetical protein SCDLUD_001647 [Saccharomycodes ludwigii]SSD61251.1 related to Golgi apparatus membrane protein TVP23 [Saccharomycodes ludwigii]
MEHIKNFYNTILKSAHPITTVLHLLFKVLPLFFYFVGGFLFHQSFTTQFITVVLLLSLDFYYTKNISGRKLVQLRWWYDDTKSPPFNIESYKQYPETTATTVINPIDDKLFWLGLYASFGTWCVLSFICFLKFEIFYLVLVVIGIVLNFWNCYGFRTCWKFNPNSTNASGVFDGIVNLSNTVTNIFSRFGAAGNGISTSAFTTLFQRQ